MIGYLVEFIMHSDKHLLAIFERFGSWTYGILFAIIFAETGLVFTPFLPGDSLLFAVGALAAIGSLDVWWVVALLSVAAILGDGANYAVGKYLGHIIYAKANGGLIKKDYIDKTHKFYEKYGSKTIVFARFVPIVRTFAPFVAGVGTMGYLKFATYNVVGGIVWVALFVLGGYYFGNMPIVKKNFSVVILGIIIVSILPAFIEYARHKLSKNKAAAKP
ncbi:MAG TPA: DedA family protein [Elusimicrobia bacterium]|nr:MAG: hypothetical protein A2278_09490 [Elusimicrobia bacterium RIFOXYA12_FULL_49_49]OGS15011.1 MAG: hypothetical protein A2251_08345 [Elusimicrobia bacterium RIFOXYA2_FULL_47_53]OGS26054.1 MAG: hypothetical protein A2339_01930 [Elusimicrobia bacterium RIFOXYB12_FULL_50_12]OGS29355.1 MAG: hypothetical protein A2323_04275 [Elusimicrobia bacterium RIFOXYB2_FULL_46_23]HBU69422.1 DedA family protein [Elusimicrobiota bacterium]